MVYCSEERGLTIYVWNGDLFIWAPEMIIEKVDRHEFAFLLSEREKNVNERPCAQNENDRLDRMRKG